MDPESRYRSPFPFVSYPIPAFFFALMVYYLQTIIPYANTVSFPSCKSQMTYKQLNETPEWNKIFPFRVDGFYPISSNSSIILPSHG